MHDFLLPFQWNGHPFRRALMRHHHFDLRAESFFVELERCFAIAVVVEIRIDLHGLLLGGRVSSLAYFSVSFFRLARPASKSLPIMLSMLVNTCITLDMKGAGPCISHVTMVVSPCGSIVNSAVL